jgi:protein TonB
MASLRIQNLDNRAIGFALLISLALHVALLSILPLLREAQQRRSDASDPIQAHLVEPSQKRVADPVPQTTPAEPVKPAPAPALPQAPRKPPRQLHPAPVAPPTQVVPPVSANDAAVAARTEPVEAGPTLSAPAPSTGTVATAPRVAPPASDAIDAGTLAQYRLSIISAARRFKRYPRVALDQNRQGRVEIRMVIGANGEISALRVRDSAGHEVLDQHALEMIERAKAMVQIPPALREREFTVDIPVVFSLLEPAI